MYNFSYAYNYAGSLTSETYPSGRTIYTCYDQDNRPLGMSLTAGCASRNYIDQLAYALQGEPSSYRYGNNLWRAQTYNSRLQWSAVTDMLSNDPGRQLLQQQLTWNAPNTADNNGTLRAVTELNGNGPGTLPIQFNQTFAYDALNRINSFSDSDPVTQTYGYDNYGNKWLSGGSNNPLEPLAQDWIDGATNRLSTTSGLFSYDGAGNLTLFGGIAMSYDAENRMTAESQTGFEPVLYLYDGEGQRVEKCQSEHGGRVRPRGCANHLRL